MKRLLLGFATVATVATLATFTPANAQGIGVQVGPLGVGVGPDYDPYWRHRHWSDDYAYAGDCRLVRTRIETPRGHIIWRTRRICD